MYAGLMLHILLRGFLIYLGTGVDEFVLYNQCSRGNDLSQICVLHHDDVVVTCFLHVLKLF